MRGERGCVRIDFLGIGAQKAATSWLHVQLANHPQVRFPAVKETHFWDNRAGRDVREWFAMFAAAPPAVIQGEITPAYGPLSEAVIREIAHAAPGVRTFYSLRNPMERAWSAAVMELERADRTPSQVPDTWFIDHFHSNASRARGDYVGTLRRWRKVLGDDAVLVLWFDEICRDPRGVLVRLAEYLRIDEEFFRDWCRLQRERRREVAQRFAPLEVIDAPLQEDEVIGLEALSAHARQLFAEVEPDAVLSKAPRLRFDRSPQGYRVRIPLPGASADDLDVVAVDGELMVRAAARRRSIKLPPRFASLSLETARLERGELIVCFGRGRGEAATASRDGSLGGEDG